jgi:hypothetical protein
LSFLYDDEEFATLAAHDEEFAAATALATTKNHVNVELAQETDVKYPTVKVAKTQLYARSVMAINTWALTIKTSDK